MFPPRRATSARWKPGERPFGKKFREGWKEKGVCFRDFVHGTASIRMRDDLSVIRRVYERMTIYAENFKDKISFARPCISTTGCLVGVGLSFLHVTPGIVGRRIIQRFAFVTKQQRGETWPRRQVTGERNLRSQVDDMSSGGQVKSGSFVESRSSVARLNKCNAANILSQLAVRKNVTWVTSLLHSKSSLFARVYVASRKKKINKYKYNLYFTYFSIILISPSVYRYIFQFPWK